MAYVGCGPGAELLSSCNLQYPQVLIIFAMVIVCCMCFNPKFILRRMLQNNSSEVQAGGQAQQPQAPQAPQQQAPQQQVPPPR